MRVRPGLSASERFIQTMLPNGRGLLAVFEAYFDESVQSQTGDFCMVGCLYTAKKAVRFTKQWRKATGGHPFHTKDERMRRSLDDPIWPRLANIITKNRKLTVAFHVDLNELREVASPGRKLEKLAYVVTTSACIKLIAFWQLAEGLEIPVSYTFASGHQGENAADGFLTGALSMAVTKEAYRYGGHAFADANELELLQGSDFAANHFSRSLVHMTARGRSPSGISMKVFSAGKHKRNALRTLTGEKLKAELRDIEADWDMIFR